jgi:hypothetical protein
VPPADQTYVVQVVGLFKNLVLASNTDSNFWSLEEPDLLLRAALYELESFSRGTENAKNWLSAIQTDVQLLEFDTIEEESYNRNQMEG